jgi:hypothetical protein
MEAWRVSDALSQPLPADIRSVVVRVVAGDVTVTSGAQPHIDVRRHAGSDVTVELNNGRLFVAQPDPDLAPIARFFKMLTEGSRHRCTVEIVVPSTVEVSVTAVSAPVIVGGIGDETKVKTVSGDVTLAGIAGEVDVATVSGEIEAKSIGSGMKLKTVSGDIAVVDGACRFVNAKSVSGDILLDLDLDPAGTYDITTVSGGVAVRTINEPNLRVDASSVSGSLVSDFGISWDSKPGKRSTSQVIGNGGAHLYVKTVSGDLRVLRGRAVA